MPLYFNAIISALVAAGSAVAIPPVALGGTFFVNLSNPVNLVIGDAQAQGMITNVGYLHPVITASRTTGVGPLAVIFNATASKIAPSLSTIPFFDVYYDWDFGDAAATSQTWQYGTRIGVSNRNTSFGPIAAHVFDEGTYTVTLRARYRGFAGILYTQTTSIVVTVSATNTLSTVYVSNTTLPVAGVDGVPIGANCQLVTVWSQIGTLSNTYKHIMLKSGESWSTDGTASLAQGPGLLGMYGGSTRPSITCAVDNSVIYLNGCSDWRIQDLYITGNGTQGGSKRFINGGSGFLGAGGNYLIQRVEMNDTLMGIGMGTCDGVFVVDCYVHDTYDASQAMGGICMYNSHVTSMAILGSRFSRSPSTHCVRLQGTANTVVQHSQFDSAGGARNALSIRGMGGSVQDGNGYYMWSGEWSENILVSDNVIDNSFLSGTGYALYCGPQAIGHAERVRNVIVERNYIAGRDAQAANFQVVSGLVVRGNIFVTRNGTAIGLGLGGNVGGSPATTDAKFMNNTVYKPDTSVVNGFSVFYFSDAGLGSGLNIANTLVYAPNNTKDGAINGTQATLYVQGGTTGVDGTQFTLTNNSSNVQINTVKPWSVAVPSTYAEYMPNSYAVNSGTYVQMFTDFFNNEITGTRDMGAIQV